MDDKLFLYGAGGHCKVVIENAFQKLIEKYRLAVTVPELLDIYRYHQPSISLSGDADALLSCLRSRGGKGGHHHRRP